MIERPVKRASGWSTDTTNDCDQLTQRLTVIDWHKEWLWSTDTTTDCDQLTQRMTVINWYNEWLWSTDTTTDCDQLTQRLTVINSRHGWAADDRKQLTDWMLQRQTNRQWTYYNSECVFVDKSDISISCTDNTSDGHCLAWGSLFQLITWHVEHRAVEQNKWVFSHQQQKHKTCDKLLITTSLTK
jgi:hypothetical protein